MNNSPTSIVRLVIIGGGIVLLIGGMRAAASIVNMVLLAYVVVILMAPIQRALTKRRVPSFLAVVLLLLLIVGIVVLVGWFVALSLRQLERNLPQYLGRINATIVDLQAWLAGLGLDLNQIQLPNSLSFSSIIESALPTLGRLATGLSNALVNAGLVLVIVFFALLEINGVPQRLFHAFSGDKEILGSLLAVNDGLRKYIILKAVTGLVMAVANTTLLLIVGVEFAVLWGLLAFFMNFVPNIGFIIALIPPVLMAFVQFGLTEAVIVLVGYLIINTLVNTLLSPRIMGQGLNLSATVIFVALIFWAWVLGGVGVFMAVPLLIMMKVLAEHYDDTKWLATAVSGKIEME